MSGTEAETAPQAPVARMVVVSVRQPGRTPTQGYRLLESDPSPKLSVRDEHLRDMYDAAKAANNKKQMTEIMEALYREHGMPAWRAAPDLWAQQNVQRFAGAATATASVGAFAILVVANPPLAAQVGIAGLVGGAVVSGASRAVDGQTPGQVVGGTLADVSGLNGVWILHYEQDVATGEPVPDPFTQGFAGTSGLYQLSALGVGGAQLVRLIPKPGMSNAALVQEIATRAELKIGGTGRVPGIYKHSYAEALLDRYQLIYGDRGLLAEIRFVDGHTWQQGDPILGSVILDVLDPGKLWRPRTIYDYKFGEAGLTAARIAQLRGATGFDNVLIVEVRP